MGEEAKKDFLGNLAPRPQLSLEHCSKLWLDLEEKLATQRQQAEVGAKMQLEDMRAQMDQDRQVVTLGFGDGCTSYAGGVL